MPMWRIDDMFVDLVRNHVGIIFLGQPQYEFEFSPGKHAPGWIGRIAQDDGFDSLCERSLKLLPIELPTRWLQMHKNRSGAGQYRVSPIVLVKGRKNDNLVTGVAHAQHAGEHSFRASAGNH